MTRMPIGRIKVLIADDHPVFRQGLRRLLESERDFLVVGEACDGPEAIALTSKLRPDIVLLDATMPGVSGLDALRELATNGSVRPVLLTSEIQRPDIVKALQFGARGVLLKSSGSELIFKGLRTVMQGQVWVDHQTVTEVVELLRQYSNAVTARASNKYGLTARQLEIVSLVVAGLTNREIATRLSITEDTVKHHLTQIFSRTGVTNRLELALFAMQHQLGKPN